MMRLLTFRHFIISTLVLFAAALSCWSIIFSRQQTDIVSAKQNEPDAFMEDAIATMMNKEGKLALKIESPKMLHYAAGDTIHITQPHVTVFRQSPQPWYIDSDYATTTDGAQQIVFSNNVVILHLADTADPTTTMKTASLTVFPKKQTAQTSDPVTIIQPDTTVQAVGMLANLDNGTVQLLSQAKGDYAPHS